MYVVREMYVGLSERGGNPENDFRNAQLYKNKIEKLKPITMQQYEYTNKIYYDHFVLPFTIGLVVLLGYLCVRYYKWIKSFPKEERKKIRKGLFSFKTIRSGWEIFRESLLHHNIFKTNPMLGYIHAHDLCFRMVLVDCCRENRIYGLSYQCFQPTLFRYLFPLFPSSKRDIPVQRVFRVLDGLDTDVPVNRDLTGCHQTFLLPYFRHEKDHETTGLRPAYINGPLAHFPGTFSSRKLYKRTEWRW